MSKVAKLVAIGMLTSLTAGFVAYKYVNRDLFAEPGQNWKNDTPHGWEELRLLETGKYVARVWCDVCPVRIVRGDWTKNADAVVLHPSDSREQSRELVEIESNGCRLLAPRVAIQQSGAVNPLMAFLREGEPCEFRPLGYIRKL